MTPQEQRAHRIGSIIRRIIGLPIGIAIAILLPIGIAIAILIITPIVDWRDVVEKLVNSTKGK